MFFEADDWRCVRKDPSSSRRRVNTSSICNVWSNRSLDLWFRMCLLEVCFRVHSWLFLWPSLNSGPCTKSDFNTALDLGALSGKSRSKTLPRNVREWSSGSPTCIWNSGDYTGNGGVTVRQIIMSQPISVSIASFRLVHSSGVNTAAMSEN